MTTFFNNAFIGIYGLFVLIFLLLYFVYNRREYLFYSFYLLAIFAYYLLFTTTIVFTDDKVNEGIANLCKEIISSIAIICYALFTIQLCDLKKFAPKLYQYNKAFVWLNIIGVLGYPMLYFAGLPNHQVYYVCTLLFAPVSLCLIYLSYRLKVPYTNYVLLGTLITTVGGIISIILSITISPNAYFPGQLAMVIDIILFIYATQSKIIDLQTENLQLRFKTLTNLQEERQRISLELHDEVGGGLSTIHLLSELTKAGSQRDKNLEVISRNSKDLVQKMNEIVWALNIKNDNLQGLVGYIRQYIVHTLDEVGILVKTALTNDVPEIAIDGKNRRAVFLIIKELVNNIMKHSKATTVYLTINITQNDFICQIQDDGIGFDETSIKANSFGVMGIQDRATKLGGTIKWYNNSGTNAILSIPFNEFSYKSAML